MKRRIILSLLAAAAVAFPQGEVVFRSDVSLVRVDVQVLDSSGRAVTGLTRNDFLLREQGQEREIRNFSYENMPVDVLILVDVSTSMRANVEKVAAASREALDVLGHDDRVAMMVFDRRTRLRLPFRPAQSDDVRMEFGRLLNQENFNGGTDITRALVDAADYVRRSGRKGVRRAVVILTDDQTEFDRDEFRVERAMNEADAVVSLLLAPDMVGLFGGRRGGGGGSWPQGGGRSGGGGIGGTLGDILLGGGRYPGGGGGGGRYPGGGGGQIPGTRGAGTQSAGTPEIARATGGDTIQIDDATALETTLARIRQRYALFFTVPDGVRAGAQRSITVELGSTARRRYPSADLRYRATYIAPDSTPPTPGVSTSSQPGESEQQPIIVNTSSVPTATAPEAEDSRPAIRRRPAVNERTGGSGPAVIAPASPSVVTAKPEAPAPAATPAPAEKKGGWRRVQEGDLKP